MEKEVDFIRHKGQGLPVKPDTLVQLRLSNGNEPINYAHVFYWGSQGRGTLFPHIEAYRLATKQEYIEYQTKLAEAKSDRANYKLLQWKNKKLSGDHNPDGKKL
jgi:hypothetical protein